MKTLLTLKLLLNRVYEENTFRNFKIGKRWQNNRLCTWESESLPLPLFASGLILNLPTAFNLSPRWHIPEVLGGSFVIIRTFQQTFFLSPLYTRIRNLTHIFHFAQSAFNRKRNTLWCFVECRIGKPLLQFRVTGELVMKCFVVFPSP